MKIFSLTETSYSDMPPEVDSLEPMVSKEDKMLFNKLNGSMKKEYRTVMLSNEDTDYINIPKKLIKAVYIGAKMDNAIVDGIGFFECKYNAFTCFEFCKENTILHGDISKEYQKCQCNLNSTHLI